MYIFSKFYNIFFSLNNFFLIELETKRDVYVELFKKYFCKRQPFYQFKIKKKYSVKCNSSSSTLFLHILSSERYTKCGNAK